MEDSIKRILMGAILIILATVLIPVIADLNNSKTLPAYSSNELFTITSARLTGNQINETSTSSNYSIANQAGTWKETDCPVTNLIYGNTSTTYVLNTDYTFNSSSGILHIKNSTKTVYSIPNQTYLTYNYCSNDYINSSFGRNILNTVGGFLAILILVIVAVYLLISGIRKITTGD